MTNRLQDFLKVLPIALLGMNFAHAQMATVTPPEATGPLTNPLMGFRPDLNGYKNNPDYPTVVRHYIKWNEIEPNVNATADTIRNFCNTKWAALPAANVKVIPRVYIDWDSEPNNEYWPSDLATHDWSSPEFKARVLRLIARLGEVWDNDPRVAWVQTGIIGYWGEQENPVGVDEDGWGQRLSDAFTAAFQNKKMVVRNMGNWPSSRFGVYWDSYGHPKQRNGAWTSIQNFNNNGRYLNEVVEGEVAYNWGIEGEFASLYGGFLNATSGQWESDEDITLGNTQYTDNMIDVIKELHCSALGWIASYNPNDPTIRANAARVQAAFGYRFHISEFSASARTEPGANLDINFMVKNTGSAPFYENWPVAVVLVDEATRQIVWRSTLPNVDVRSWKPGHNYSYQTHAYQTPALVHQISASIPLPTSLPAKSYLVGVTVLEPLSRTPGLFFAVPNFFKESQTQPLCRIGVGVDVTNHELTGVLFNDLVKDETRSYTMTQQGASYTLTATPSSLGNIVQPAPTGTYLQDTGVEVKAVGILGYGFTSWGGALAGSTRNPATVVMDANKTVSANYAPVAVHQLTTSSTNGSIILSPPGGQYNVGTEVTLTAVPSEGYALGSWGGGASGAATSTTIIMTGDLSVSANFVIAPIIGETSFRVNSGGPVYTAGSGEVFAADQRFSGGSTITHSSTLGIANTTDDTLYQSYRFGNSFNYSIPLANGDYRVTLMFAETFFNTAGNRVFNVAMEGLPIITGLDILTKVPKNTAYNEIHYASVSDGVLNINFTRTIDNARISAIRVERAQRPNSFTLQASSANGAVIMSPPGGVYDAGTVVTLTGSPSSQYVFSSWGGDALGSSATTTINMDGNKSVTAAFAPQQTPSFTLTTNSINGTVTLNPPGGVYVAGTVVTLTASPSSGYTFSSWSGDALGSSTTTSVTMDGNKSVTATFSPPSKKVLLIVSNAAALNAADAAIQSRLQAMGHTVTVMTAASSVKDNSEGKNLIIVSSTVISSDVGTKFRDVPVPVINWETALQDDFLFSTAQSTPSNQTALNIVNSGHPLAAGFPSGSLPVMTGTTTSGFSAGQPLGTPIIIARINQPAPNDFPCIYAYETGFGMHTGTAAPARRVHLFLQNDTYANLNNEGKALFDAAVTWAMSSSSSVTDPYVTWAGGAAFDQDANNDGMSNGLAWLLGATSPTSAAPPCVVTNDDTSLTMTFSMRNAGQRGSSAVYVQHSSDLGVSDPWSLPRLVPDTAGLSPTEAGVTFNVVPGNPLNQVTVTISNSEASVGSLFSRLVGEK